jgi:hypothetical protein
VANGSEVLHDHGGRRLTVPGVGLVEVSEPGGVPSVRVLEPLAPEQYERLALWLEHEWPERRQR